MTLTWHHKGPKLHAKPFPIARGAGHHRSVLSFLTKSVLPRLSLCCDGRAGSCTGYHDFQCFHHRECFLHGACTSPCTSRLEVRHLNLPAVKACADACGGNQQLPGRNRQLPLP